jgi:hypothetical protein
VLAKLWLANIGQFRTLAKVWAIVEVPYTQANAWVMAVWAKVVGQVNG